MSHEHGCQWQQMCAILVWKARERGEQMVTVTQADVDAFNACDLYLMSQSTGEQVQFSLITEEAAEFLNEHAGMVGHA